MYLYLYLYVFFFGLFLKLNGHLFVYNQLKMKYRKWNLHEKVLSEQDYKFYILEDYTFLKRPVIMNQDTIFIGNSKETVELAKKSLHA